MHDGFEIPGDICFRKGSTGRVKIARIALVFASLRLATLASAKRTPTRCLPTQPFKAVIICYQCVCSKCYPCVCPLPTPALSHLMGEGESSPVLQYIPAFHQ